MSRDLKISIGQHSDKGRKESNQDFHGAMIPRQPLLGSKGIAVALADGISSSPVSRVAAESAVKGFLTYYYCTSDAWSVKTSAQRVIAATNSWLHSQTRRSRYSYDLDKGYVCTMSAMVIKAATAHLFHVGDSIDADGVGGTVTGIGLFTVEMETEDGVYMSVPNSALWNKPIKNFSRLAERQLSVAVGIPYGGDLAKALAILRGLRKRRQARRLPRPEK